jgi:hypothetical protein
MSVAAPSTIVGSTKQPPGLVAARAPRRRRGSRRPAPSPRERVLMSSTAPSSISGPISVPRRAGSPMATARVGLHQAVGDSSAILVDDEAARRGAALAGGAHGAEEDRAQRPCRGRLRADDDRVVAAELEDGAAEALRRPPRRRASPSRVEPVAETSGRRVVRAALADRRAAADDEAKIAGRARRRRRPRCDLRAGDGGQRGLAPTASRPSCRRRRGERRVPGPHGDREVERADDADDAERDATARTCGGPGRSECMVRP